MIMFNYFDGILNFIKYLNKNVVYTILLGIYHYVLRITLLNKLPTMIIFSKFYQIVYKNITCTSKLYLSTQFH